MNTDFEAYDIGPPSFLLIYNMPFQVNENSSPDAFRGLDLSVVTTTLSLRTDMAYGKQRELWNGIKKTTTKITTTTTKTPLRSLEIFTTEVKGKFLFMRKVQPTYYYPSNLEDTTTAIKIIVETILCDTVSIPPELQIKSQFNQFKIQHYLCSYTHSLVQISSYERLWWNRWEIQQQLPPN